MSPWPFFSRFLAPNFTFKNMVSNSSDMACTAINSAVMGDVADTLSGYT